MLRRVSVPYPKAKALHQSKADLFTLQKKMPPGCPPRAALLCKANTAQKSKELKKRCSDWSKGFVLQAGPASEQLTHLRCTSQNKPQQPLH